MESGGFSEFKEAEKDPRGGGEGLREVYYSFVFFFLVLREQFQ